MTDQTETAGGVDGVFAEHARNTVIDLAARVVHEVVSKELGLTRGSEPTVTDVVAVQALAARDLLVPVDLFEDRARQRAEDERMYATVAETVYRLREAGVLEGDGLVARVRNLIAERDQLKARIDEIREVLATQWVDLSLAEADFNNVERIRWIATREEAASPSTVDSGEAAAKLPDPDGCRYCHASERGHYRRWTDGHGWHQWAPPSNATRLARMRARREATQPPSPFVPAADAFPEEQP